MRAFTGKADVAIVLGNAVRDDWSLSPVLQGRVDEALDLYRKGQVKKIFVSGGIGLENKIPEGEAMKAYLVKKGVNSEDVIIDNDGINTYYTAIDFITLNKQEKYHSAVVVSSFYHILRSKYILKKLGYKNVYSASSSTILWNDWVGLPRDCIAFYKYWLVY
jgi:uncharacterized SAM-binding protein YcdF (DUF218 family)